MADKKNERRKFERYDTEVKIYFQVAYDIKTVVKFKIVEQGKKKSLSKKYSAVSKNVSAEGMCFTCEKKLKKSDTLRLEVFLPKQKVPIRMQGEVRWSRESSEGKAKKKAYDTGVKLVMVDGEFVPASLYRDDTYKIVWSAVLESVLGSFKKFAHNRNSTA